MNGDYGSLMTLQSSCQFALFFFIFRRNTFSQNGFPFRFIFGSPKSADDSLIKILMIQNEIVYTLPSPKLFQTQSTEKNNIKLAALPIDITFARDSVAIVAGTDISTQ